MDDQAFAYRRTGNPDHGVLEGNIRAGREISDALRTTLGPNGMNKLLVDNEGMAMVTNNGESILKEMALDHPVADMFLEVAKTQTSTAGDGTTTAVVLTGELLRQAEDLIELGLHPTTVITGYLRAVSEAETVLDELALEVQPDDKTRLNQVAATALAGKVPEGARATLADVAVNAVRSTAGQPGGSEENVRFEHLRGASTADSYLLRGVFLHRGRVHPGMPLGISDARIMVLDDELGIRNPDAELRVTDANQLQQVVGAEHQQLRSLVDRFAEAGTNVVVCRKKIDDVATRLLAEKGIYAIKQLSSEDIPALARATGAWVLNDPSNFEPGHLGVAGRVVEETIDGETCTRIDDAREGDAVTIVLRGGTVRLIDELHRASKTALQAVRSTLADNRALPGGGSAEVAVARELRRRAYSVEGREQLAMEAFADAVETVPRTLFEGAGVSPMDGLLDLRTRQDAGETGTGIEVNSGKIRDMFDEGILDPRRVKVQAIDNAVHAAVAILRIDDVVHASDLDPNPALEDSDQTD